jgi:hypothetical protein
MRRVHAHIEVCCSNVHSQHLAQNGIAFQCYVVVICAVKIVHV